MSFSFLLPLGLALSVLVVGPVIAHLVRRLPRTTRRYGAMLLLQRLQQKVKRRRRVRDLWLLILRILAVWLAVFAISQPRFEWIESDAELGSARAVVVVVDTSMSMDQLSIVSGRAEGETLLGVARSRAAGILRDLPGGTLVGLVTAGGTAAVQTAELTEDRALVATIAESLRQTQGLTDLAGGIRHARRLLDGGGGVVVVITDESGPLAVPEAREEIALLLEQGGSLQPEAIHPPVVSNLTVTEAVYGEGLEGGSIRIGVANYGVTDMEVPLIVSLPGGVEITAFAEVPAGQSVTEVITVPRVSEGGVGIVRLEDPSLRADNEFAFHLPQVGASRVLVVDGDPGPNPVLSEVYFLERALAPWGGADQMGSGVLPDVTSMAGIHDLDPEIHRVVFMSNVADPGVVSARLVDFVQRGGAVVFSMGSNVTAERYNGPLASLLPARLRRPRALVNPGEPGIATRIPDTEGGFFGPFSRGGRASFSNIRWQQLYTVEPSSADDSVQTLMSLENGLPLMMERRVGRGRVLLFTGTLDMDWGNFPLQAVYMPVIQRMVTELGAQAGGAALREVGTVDRSLAIPVPDSAVDLVVEGPEGPVASTVSGGMIRFTPERAGAYVVEMAGAPPLARVAVNVDPIESDVSPGTSLLDQAVEVNRERFTRRLDLGPWLWWSVLSLAMLQALLSLWMGRRRMAREESNSMGSGGEVRGVG